MKTRRLPKTAMPTTFKKYDIGKRRMDLIPTSALNSLADVLTYGARKYSDRNWELGTEWGRYYSAALRHLVKWWDGEDYDQESGIHHLCHAMCCVAFLYDYVYKKRGKDDRPVWTKT